MGKTRTTLSLAAIWLPFVWLSTQLWFVCDDAFISFRYARNLARGLGLRFNLGEGPPVEGFSNLLWVLIAAIPESLGAATDRWMPAISFACGLAFLWVFYRTVRDRWVSSPTVALLTTLLLSTSVSFCMWASGGLATMPQALLTFLLFERLFLSRSAPAWRGAAACAVLLTLLRTEGIAWVLLLLGMVPLVWRGSDQPWQPALRRVVVRTLPVLVMLLTWRYLTYDSLISNTAAVKVGFGPERVVRGLKYVASFGLITLTPVICLLGAPWAIRSRGRIGWAVLLMALAPAGYSVLVGGDFMPMGRFLVPGLAFSALLGGSAIDAAWSRRPRHRLGIGLVALSLAVLGALPGIEPGATEDEGMPDDAGIHLAPRSIRAAIRFKYLMRDRRFTSDLKSWEGMGSRAEHWARTGAAMAEVLPPDASVVKGGIGALGYHSDLYIHDLFGLVSPQIIPHRFRNNPNPKGPGHDVFVRPTYFLREKPTIFRHKLIRAPNVDGKVRSSVHKWKISAPVRAAYAPAIYALGGTSTDAADEVLLVLQRIQPPMTSEEAWKQYARQVRALVFNRGDVARGATEWQGHTRPDRVEPAASGSHPNVLIVIWDTVRADHLSPYGYDLNTTPWLRRFAEESVLYERAVSPAMWTVPSHASMFTGLPPSGHGIVPYNRGELDPRFLTMAECFGARGFGTYLFSANPFVSHITNLDRGFDTAEYPWDKQWKERAEAVTTGKLLADDASNPLGPSFVPGPIKTGRAKDMVKETGPLAAEALERWLDGREHRGPWLAVLNYMEAHVPRIPSLASRKALFSDEQIAAQMTLNQAYINLLLFNYGLQSYSEEELDIINQVYDASIRDLDTATEGLIATLKERGELDNTVIVLTSDHGEQLGEHSMIGHKYSVYNPLVRVPLVVRYPAKLTPRRVTQPVSMLGLYSSLLELSEVQPCTADRYPSLMTKDAESGPVFSELLDATTLNWRRILKVHPDFSPSPWMTTYQSVEHGDFKLIRSSKGETSLYNIEVDPGELENITTQDPERTEQMMAHIDGWLTSFRQYISDPGHPEDADGEEISPEMRARLESLGYLDDE